jgi:hypothetical protein
MITVLLRYDYSLMKVRLRFDEGLMQSRGSYSLNPTWAWDCLQACSLNVEESWVFWNMKVPGPLQPKEVSRACSIR